MTEFNELFVDVDAYRPVGRWHAWAREIMVWLMVAMLLVAGWYFKEWMSTQFRYLALAENAPAVPYPAQWLPQPASEQVLLVLDPHSQSGFPAREEVLIMPVPENDIVLAWPEHRAQTLRDYHELNRMNVTLSDGRPALLLSYTYVAETEDSQSAPLTIVRASDLAFVMNDGQRDKLVVLTLAADVHEWEEQEPLFQRILQAMGVPLL